ncbi:hypothetical protein [Sphingorhabdus sp.]|uniref:hypothetical protein n=1 Tax=Sphingorhabdus sp. TaxID=1902408 RepID=UPI003341F499
MDRFALETAITACFNTSEDLKLVTERVLEGGASADMLANTLIGIQELHELRCQRAFDIFEALLKSGKIS